MLNLGITFLCAIFFLLSGRLIQFVKRIIQIIVELFLRVLNLLGVKIRKGENRLKVSPLFKQTYKDITVVKKSKQNQKTKSSINFASLLLIILSLSLIIINLDSISGNAISKWIFNLEINNTRIAPYLFIKTQKDMDITFTAIMFSVLSFSASKLVSQWKDTSQFRKAKKEMKMKESVVSLMSSKELLDAAKIKDAQKYEELSSKEENK